MELNFLIFRNPPKMPLNEHLQSKIKWVPCSKSEFLQEKYNHQIFHKETIKPPNLKPFKSKQNFPKKIEKINSNSDSSIENLNETKNEIEEFPDFRKSNKSINDTDNLLWIKKINDEKMNKFNKNESTFYPESFNGKDEISSKFRKNYNLLTGQISLQNKVVRKTDLPILEKDNKISRFITNHKKSKVTEISNRFIESAKSINCQDKNRELLRKKTIEEKFVFNCVFEENQLINAQPNKNTEINKKSLFEFQNRNSRNSPQKDTSKERNFQKKAMTPLGPVCSRSIRGTGSRPRLVFVQSFSGTEGSISRKLSLSKIDFHPQKSKMFSLYSIPTEKTKIEIEFGKSNLRKIKARKYPLSSEIYKVTENGKEYFLHRKIKPAKKPDKQFDKSRKFPCLFLSPKENKNKDYLLIYFHANGEDLSTANHFLQNLCDALSTKILAPEYPGYSIYENETPSESKIIENVETLVLFLTQTMGLQTRNLILIGSFKRKVLGMLVCNSFEPRIRCSQLHFNISFFLVFNFGGKFVRDFGQQIYKGLFSK